MGTGARAEWPAAVLGVLAGAVCLWLANRALDPVPLSAGGAYAAGALVLLVLPLRPMPPGYVALGALAGAAPSVWVHRGWHLEGASTPVPASLTAHVLGEGLLGLAVALGCLGVAVLGWRRLRSAR